jgi:uncharacterized membrane protein YfcA
MLGALGAIPLVVVSLTVFVAYVIFGICGFGSTLIAVPLMAHFFPLKFVIPVIVLVDCVASVRQGLRLRAGMNKPELLAMLPFLLVGMVAGAWLLVRTPGNVLLPLLGVFVTAYGVYYATRHESVFRVARWTAAPIGFFAGAISSVFGMAGPFYVMYLVGRGSTPDQIRATMPVVFIFTTIGRIALFGAIGLITQDVLVMAALLAPVMLLGVWCGNRWHSRFTRENVVRAIGAVLTLSGASLLLRAL